MGDGGEEHAGGARGRVVDGLTGPGFEHLGHQVDDGTVGVELGCGVTGVVGELLYQKLVADAELVLGEVGERECAGAEVLYELAQQMVGQAVLVGPRRVAEDAVEGIRVGLLDGAQGVLNAFADLPDLRAHDAPVGFGRDLEAVLLWKLRVPLVAAGIREGLGTLLIVDVAQALVEEQREDELLVLPRVDGAAQQGRRAPQVRLQLGLGNAISPRADSPSRFSSSIRRSSAE